mgnify:CR=1 FL=1
MKADFRTYDNKKGFCDFDNFSIKSLDELYPSFYGDLVLGFHYCSFNNSTKNGFLIVVFILAISFT